MKNKKYIITFAGAIGCSKTPIANYLSTRLNLSVFNNDAIRTEVSEDLGHYNEIEYLKRRDIRLKFTLEQNKSFILDASVDRVWPDFRVLVNRYKYQTYIISIDLNKSFLKKLYKIKGYNESANRLNSVLLDHEKFLSSYANQVNLHISDKDFSKRLEKSYKAIRNWLNK